MKRKHFRGFMIFILGLFIPTFSFADFNGTLVAAINCGGPEYTDGSGVTYQADNSFTGGSVYTTPAFIEGTADQTLYQSERWGEFSYNIPVPEQAWYLVTLKFAEIYPYAYAGSRKFTVVIEGQKVIMDLDLFPWAGGKNKTFEARIPVMVLDWALTIEFYGEQYCPQYSRNAGAKVNAILVTSLVTSFQFTPPGPVVAAINAGGQEFTDTSSGITYEADKYYGGGNTYSTTENIFHTDNDPLFQTERFGDFSYNIPVANDTYWIVLRFAEIYPYILNGARRIAVDIEGKRVISNLDLYTMLGKYRPYDFVVPFPIKVDDGVLSIHFYGEECCPNSTNADFNHHPSVCRQANAKVSAILVGKENKPVLE